MVISLFLLTLGLYAQGDPRSLRLMGTALEGPVDSVRQQLVASGFKEWGQSDDGEVRSGDNRTMAKTYTFVATSMAFAPN